MQTDRIDEETAGRAVGSRPVKRRAGWPGTFFARGVTSKVLPAGSHIREVPDTSSTHQEML